ncbi:aminoglycoside phosphotransferase family protein [Trichococcus pasteurii]|uniref:Nucleotide-diphospho-sugar transferases n=1 Tax=Trichococcus pasteurii TaxID=43064 RepID=A0A1W1IJ20_9LACT|nr:capsular biosynthesis protein [Trichococcus pasteurii]SFF09104.1 hypothetical protein SAMN04488086_1269 [Trichococcus pasteurii]SLM52743.1 nucleotide-diphospho-sugar transferases [Trichococcus pasteurii]SSB93624.1 nucleotide-diphospho-sugar transferases [Trichococcus pasteurii]
MKKIIIPSAKVVPKDLQNLGKIPAVIYPVDDRTMLDCFLEVYKDYADTYEVITYEAAEKVRNYARSYSENINIHKLNDIRDLGYSIYSGINYSKCKSEDILVINFGDTIVFDKLNDINEDMCFYSEDYISDTWTFFSEKKGIISEIWDKQEISSKEAWEKLFVGVFFITRPLEFQKFLENSLNENTNIDSFYRALMDYSKVYPMQMRKADKWFDIGHADRYFDTQIEVKARSFNHISIDKNRGILSKTSEEKEKFLGEILWYLKLPTDIEYVRPRIFSYSIDYNNPYINMEYYAYHTLHELFLFGDLSQKQWADTFKRIKFIINDFERYKVSDDGINDAIVEMYLNKTMARLEKMKENSKFKDFFDNSIIVNGIEYKSLSEICEILPKIIIDELCDVRSFNIIHGDLCFANIMIDSNLTFIKVIDPRGKFGKYDIYGDRRYELAKLFHSLDGKYDYIIKDLFYLEVNDTNIKYYVNERKRDFDLYESFVRCFKEEIGEEIKKIELIQSLLFLSMIPLHTESEKHQLAMLATGLEILNRVIDIRK